MKERMIIDGIDAFLRKNYGEFSVQSINRHLRLLSIDFYDFDILSYVRSHPLVFTIGENTFITRASVFTDAYFSIKPSKIEISQGLLIPGHRCMPFVDPDIYPHEITFVYNSCSLQKKVVQLPLNDIIESSFLFGEEYIPQLFAADPANASHDFIKNDYTLPNIVDCTTIDMRDVYEQLHFQYGDRLLAKVIDWNAGVIELEYQQSQKASPFEITEEDESRDQWFNILDEALLHSISLNGPLAGIEEQLSYTFYANTSSLCTKFCCSIEEYMNLDRSISIEYYGVESRLWKKGEEIPAIGTWNENLKETDDLMNTLYEEIGIPIPFYMLDAYIFDALFHNEKGVMGIYNKMIPEKNALYEEQSKVFINLIQERYEKLEKKYNRFLDFETGEVRSRSLELYSALVSLICELDTCGLPASSLPQQQLVIVSQLFSHTTKFIEAFMTEVHLSKDDITMISSSLDGMTESFDDVSSELTLAMGKKNIDGFTIIQ